MRRIRSLICEEIQRGLCGKGKLGLGNSQVDIEIADTQPSRSLGLMHRSHLRDRTGMLFVFPKSDYHSFWMKNTHVPLSIAFIDENGIIANIEDLEPGDMISKHPARPVCYALELNAGDFERLDAREGDKISGLPGMSIS